VSTAELIGDRYELRRELGHGGVAVVHEAFDRVSGRRIALKRVLAKYAGSEHRRAVQLFEREFHTLTQLAHPRIVAVYDYAVDDAGPYYTMELLDGGDLQQLVPVDWRKACALARDVCSALSLLHSRRVVHRDVSARNIRCTGDGLAKLIDLGAMTPMGPNKQMVVGTPPYVCPEALDLMPLDARADLYSLGATLYYALAGRHAFAARTFQDLKERWESSPPPPSALVPGIPSPLDALVLDLMQLDRTARPASAAEVIERLSAIEGVEVAEQLLVAQAYLSTPVLVGRDDELRRTRRATPRAVGGRGGAVLVSGAEGVGRSRFLDACVLDAKLDGAIVLRADADDAAEGDFSTVRSLARSAVAALPASARELGRPLKRSLASLIPELLEPGDSVPPQTDTRPVRAELQGALRDWFLGLSRVKPLFVAVDDLHRIDEASLACLALLSHELRRSAIAVVATIDRDAKPASPVALKLLSDNATRITLENLSLPDTEELLASVFGEVPNVGLLADRIYRVSHGNPRDTMRLAQHLLDRRHVRYAAGAWTLPSELDALDLPSSMAHALLARVEGLSAGARELACTLSLSPGLAITFDEVRALSAHGEAPRTMENLSELFRAEILRNAGDLYELSQQTWAAALQQDLHEDRVRELELRLARLFELRKGQEFRVGLHLIRGGELSRGVEILALQSEALEDGARRRPEEFFNFLRSLPADWFRIYEEAIDLCERLGRPAKEAYLLRCRVAALVSVGGTSDRVQVPALIAQLADESGLSDWAKLDTLDPKSRLMTAMGKARERYAARAERDRVLDPGTALRQLARVLIQGSAVLTSALDVAGSLELPSLAPFVPLSPALGVIEQLIKGMIARMSGRTEEAQAAYAKVLARTAEPDRAGLDESHHINMRLGLMSGLGMIEAGMGLKACLSWASQVETEPLYQVNAVHIRMLYHLFQGNTREAVRCQHQVDLLKIQGSARQFFEGTHLIWQIVAYASSSDLTRTKQTIDEIEVLCRRYPGWLPVLHYGRGEHHRIRRDPRHAIEELERGLALVQAGEHQIWAYLAGAHLGAMHDAGRDGEALALAEEYVASADRARLGYVRNYVAMPFSAIQARLGQGEAAVATADGVLEAFTALGATGLNLGLAHEARARVAALLGDREGFERYSALFKDTFSAAANPALESRLQNLFREARLLAGGPPLDLVVRDEQDIDLVSSRALSMLDTCESPAERAQVVLSCLSQSSGASDAYLFLLTDEGPICAAHAGGTASPAEATKAAEQYLAAHLEDVQTMTNMATDAAAGLLEWAGTAYHPVLLSHASPSGVSITGVALFAASSGLHATPPPALASELSRRVEQLGDAVATVLKD
jgi:hypothetical protein